MNTLVEKHCLPCEGGVQPLDLAAAVKLKEKLQPRWKLSHDGKAVLVNGVNTVPTPPG